MLLSLFSPCAQLASAVAVAALRQATAGLQGQVTALQTSTAGGFAAAAATAAAQSQRFDGLADAVFMLLGGLTRDPPAPLPPAEAAGVAAALLPPPSALTATSVCISLLLPDGDIRLRRFELDEDASNVQKWAATCVPHRFGRRFELQFTEAEPEGPRVLRCPRGESLRALGLRRDRAVRMLWPGEDDVRSDVAR